MSPITLRLAELRKRAGISQAELARRSGVHQPTISRIERGETRSAGLEIIGRLADALGVPAAILIDHEPPKRRG